MVLIEKRITSVNTPFIVDINCKGFEREANYKCEHRLWLIFIIIVVLKEKRIASVNKHFTVDFHRNNDFENDLQKKKKVSYFKVHV